MVEMREGNKHTQKGKKINFNPIHKKLITLGLNGYNKLNGCKTITVKFKIVSNESYLT